MVSLLLCAAVKAEKGALNSFSLDPQRQAAPQHLIRHPMNRAARLFQDEPWRELMVVVVEDQEAEIAPVAQAVDAAQNLGQPRIVNALAGEDAHMDGPVAQFRATVEFEGAEIGNLHQGDFVRVDFVDRLDGRLIGQKMEGIEYDTEIRMMDCIHQIPGIPHTPREAPPRDRLVPDPDPHGHRQVGQLA